MAPEMSQEDKPPRTFLDTNILVCSDDPRDPAKQARAFDLIHGHLRGRTGVVFLQVLQEYFVSARGKLNLDAKLARRRVEVFARSSYLAGDETRQGPAAFQPRRLPFFQIRLRAVQFLRLGTCTTCRCPCAGVVFSGAPIPGGCGR